MENRAKRQRVPATRQPSKAEIEEDASINATPDALAWAVTRGGAERRDETKPTAGSESDST